MKVILKETLENKGKKGEIIEVKSGYARNYLIPQKKVVEATEKTMKLAEQWKEEQKQTEEKEKQDLQLLAEAIQTTPLTITREAKENGELYGAISSAEMIEELQQKGISATKEWGKSIQPIKKTGTHIIHLQLPYKITATATVTVEQSS